MKKINLLHTLVIAVIVLCFSVSFRLDNYAEIIIFTFAILFTIAYIISIVITSDTESFPD